MYRRKGLKVNADKSKAIVLCRESIFQRKEEEEKEDWKKDKKLSHSLSLPPYSVIVLSFTLNLH